MTTQKGICIKHFDAKFIKHFDLVIIQHLDMDTSMEQGVEALFMDMTEIGHSPECRDCNSRNV